MLFRSPTVSLACPGSKGCMNSVIHCTKDHEMEIWHRLGSTKDLPEVEHRVVMNQQIMANEYDQFVEKLSDFVNQEFRQFGWRLTLLEGTSPQIPNIGKAQRASIVSEG